MTPADTTMEYSIPAKRKELDTNRTYTGWLVKSKEVGWFFSKDNKWATKQEIIIQQK